MAVNSNHYFAFGGKDTETSLLSHIQGLIPESASTISGARDLITEGRRRFPTYPDKVGIVKVTVRVEIVEEPK